MIVDYGLGHTGSVHDSYAFTNTRTWKEDGKNLFRPGEWMWADSAYPCTPWCVPPYKKPPNSTLSRRQRQFNYYLSKVRVRSEHTMGLLKGRFQSLRELRLRISDRDTHDLAVTWIRCCLILHNMIIILEEQEGDTDDTWRQDLLQIGLGTVVSPESPPMDDAFEPSLPALDPVENLEEGPAFRERVVQALFGSHLFTTTPL